MDYYAFLNSNNVVTEVIPGKDQGSENTDWEQWYGEFRGQVCKRSRMDGFRKNYAGIGYTYDATRDAFIPPQPSESCTLNENTCRWVFPQPFPSWTLNQETGSWDSPVSCPTDGQRYYWDEETTSWVLINV
jgi:hypothetical protein